MSETVNEIIKEYIVVSNGIKTVRELGDLFIEKSKIDKDYKYRLQKAILMSDTPLDKSLNMVNIMSILTLDDFIGFLKAHNMV